MRKIKWDSSNPTMLHQISHPTTIGLVLEEEVFYGNITCKDYYQELLAYLIENKFSGTSTHGLMINPDLFSKYQNQDFYDFVFYTKGVKVEESSAKVENYLAEICKIDESFKDVVLSTVNTNNGKVICLSIPSKLISPTYYKLSFILGAIREIIRVDFEPQNLLFNPINIDILKTANIFEKDYAPYLENILKETKGSQSMTMHNYSGIKAFFNHIIRTYKDYSVVAVYGTLKKGFYNHYLIANSPMIAELKSSILGNSKYASMYHLGGFPGIKFDSNVPKRLQLELYFVDKATESRLDRLEGYLADRPTEGLYNKIEINVLGTPCKIYEYNGNPRKEIESGNFQ